MNGADRQIKRVAAFFSRSTQARCYKLFLSFVELIILYLNDAINPNPKATNSQIIIKRVHIGLSQKILIAIERTIIKGIEII